MPPDMVEDLATRDLQGARLCLEMARTHPDPEGQHNLLDRAGRRLWAARTAIERHTLTHLIQEVETLQKELSLLSAGKTGYFT